MRCITLRKLLVLAGSALWLAGLGWIDRATGYELGLFLPGRFSANANATSRTLSKQTLITRKNTGRTFRRWPSRTNVATIAADS